MKHMKARLIKETENYWKYQTERKDKSEGIRTFHVPKTEMLHKQEVIDTWYQGESSGGIA